MRGETSPTPFPPISRQLRGATSNEYNVVILGINLPNWQKSELISKTKNFEEALQYFNERVE